MIFGKNLILVLSLAVLFCENASAMRSMKFVLGSTNSLSKPKALPRMSRSFSSDEKAPQDINNGIPTKKYQYAKEILETPIIPQKKPLSYILPNNFFIEKRDNVTLGKVNERIFHVRRNIIMKKEFLIKNEIKQEK